MTIINIGACYGLHLKTGDTSEDQYNDIFTIKLTKVRHMSKTHQILSLQYFDIFYKY